MFPLEPCSFPYPAPHPPFLSRPLPWAHPGHALTCLIPLSLRVAGPCSTTRLISDRASLAWCASCKVEPYSLHIGSLECHHRESHLQLSLSRSTIPSRDALLAQGNTRHSCWFTRRTNNSQKGICAFYIPGSPPFPPCCDHSLARHRQMLLRAMQFQPVQHPEWAACSGLIGTA